jgi:hypothetical protein
MFAGFLPFRGATRLPLGNVERRQARNGSHDRSREEKDHG